MKPQTPPRWATRFLAWYCNPALLEEIQGDALELYSLRLQQEGKRNADLKYIRDVLRFCRWSNIRRESDPYSRTPSALWQLTFRMAVRQAAGHHMLFLIRSGGLALALAFSLLLAAYVSHELTYDQFHTHYQRLYRVTSHVDFGDRVIPYAVTPLPIGKALHDLIPEVERACRFLYEEAPVFRLGDQAFHDETTLTADSNFLRMFTFDFIAGTPAALDAPGHVVLTERTARKFFGHTDVVGKTLTLAHDLPLYITAVIRDIPANSHLGFGILLSWGTLARDDDWGNLNAYTYLLLKQDASLAQVQQKLPAALTTFQALVERDYNARYTAVLERIDAIHFSALLEEDIAQKKNKTNLLILLAVIVLFVVTGIVNYLNLTLTELTTHLRKIGVMRVFGGSKTGHRRIVFVDMLLTMMVALPIAALLVYVGLAQGRRFFSMDIVPQAFYSPLSLGVCLVFFISLLLSTQLNALLLSRAGRIADLLRGKLDRRTRGLSTRKVLVGTQLAFSMIMMGLALLAVDQFHYLQRADKGFDDNHVVLIKLRSGPYEQVQSFQETLRALPGVEAVAASTYYPGVLETKYVFQPEISDEARQALIPLMVCTPEYPAVLGLHLVAGRTFESNDAGKHYIINEAAARQFGWTDPVGKQLRGPVGGAGESFQEGEVVGVVKDFHFSSLHHTVEPIILLPACEDWPANYVYVRTQALPPPNLVATLQKQFQVYWPEAPFEWEYLDTKYMHLYDKDNEMKRLFQAGLVVSLLLSCLGIFSLSALLVQLRTREMGIRKMLGATPLSLFLLHGKSFLQFMTVALAVAYPATHYLSGQWLGNFAYHVSLTPWHFIVPAALVFLITFLTAAYHGIRSAQVNPIDTLKYE